MRKVKALILSGLLFLAGLFMTACSNDSDIVSKNLSKDADNYKVYRQIVLYNAITDKYVLEIQGYCALGNHDRKGYVSYTCASPDGYVKDIIQKSDNTIVFVHQMHPKNVSKDHFKVVLNPSEVIPDFEIR